MATKLKPVDAVVVGVGLSGSILAKELAEAGLHVVGLERGRWRDTDPDFAMPYVHDELRYVGRHELMQDLSRETITFRNNAAETALPMRQLGSFRPGEGVGGAAVHWGGLTWRFLPWDFETRSRTLARVSESAAQDLLRRRALHAGRGEDGLQALSDADRRGFPCLYQRIRRDHQCLRLLRLLPVLRLRDGREGEPADRGAAEPDAAEELRAAHPRQRHQGEPRRRRKARHRRHVRRFG